MSKTKPPRRSMADKNRKTDKGKVKAKTEVKVIETENDKVTVKDNYPVRRNVRAKLLSAAAMLLLSAIMLTATTYAWITISVNPEVKEIRTTVAGNGYLQVALQSPQQGATSARAAITTGRGMSSAVTSVANSNASWGNIVDLSTGYGIDAVSFYPARIVVNRANTSVNTDGYLDIPLYGADGRIKGLERASFLKYNNNDVVPFTVGRTYGVNILGLTEDNSVADETVTYYYRRSMIRDEAAGYVEWYRTELHDQVVALLEAQQVGIFNILLRASQLINGGGVLTGNTWTDDNINTAKAIIRQMIVIARESEASLKWALLAEAVADDITYPPDDAAAMQELGNLYRQFQTYPLTGAENSIRSIAEANGYDELVEAVDSILRAETQLQQAATYIASNDTASNAFLLIIDVQNTFLKNGSELEPDGPGMGNPTTGTIHRVYEVVDPNVKLQGQPARGIYYNYVKKIYSDYLYFTGATPGPTTGLFSIMANLVGDFQVTTQAYFKSSSPFSFNAENNAAGTWKLWTMYIRATGKNGTGNTADAIGMNAVSRFNIENNRGVLGNVYNEIMNYDPGNAMISFSVDKMNGTAYGYSIDLAFMSGENCNLLLAADAVSRVDGAESAELMGGGSCESFTLSGDLTGVYSRNAKALMENIYIVLTDTDTGGILGIVAADDPQVVLEQGTANLAVYEPLINSEGILTKGVKRTSNVITSLTANTPSYITAIVFLNGDTLPSGTLAATQRPSLYGTVNLQFACSAELNAFSYSGFIAEGN